VDIITFTKSYFTVLFDFYQKTKFSGQQPKMFQQDDFVDLLLQTLLDNDEAMSPFVRKHQPIRKGSRALLSIDCQPTDKGLVGRIKKRKSPDAGATPTPDIEQEMPMSCELDSHCDHPSWPPPTPFVKGAVIPSTLADQPTRRQINLMVGRVLHTESNACSVRTSVSKK